MIFKFLVYKSKSKCKQTLNICLHLDVLFWILSVFVRFFLAAALEGTALSDQQNNFKGVKKAYSIVCPTVLQRFGHVLMIFFSTYPIVADWKW